MQTDAQGALVEAPTGWYALGTAAALRSGTLERHTVGGEELVLFRTASGRVAALSAWCPHMGAHLGHGGRVVGEGLRCPMHGFEWSGEGACVHTPYGALPKTRATPWHVRERNGLILVWFCADGSAPSWEVPEVDTGGWTPVVLRRYDVKSHPQETSENSVDLGHFAAVHDYSDVRIDSPLETDGPVLKISYRARRPLFGTRMSMGFVYRVQVFGLGYSFVEVDIPEWHLRTRHFVLSTPSEPGRVTLRIGAMVPTFGRLAPVMRGLVGPYVQGQYEHDVAQDFAIWEHKRYQDPPALAAGDGPVGAYRRWARQFYPSLRGAKLSVVGPSAGA